MEQVNDLLPMATQLVSGRVSRTPRSTWLQSQNEPISCQDPKALRPLVSCPSSKWNIHQLQPERLPVACPLPRRHRPWKKGLVFSGQGSPEGGLRREVTICHHIPSQGQCLRARTSLEKAQLHSPQLALCMPGLPRMGEQLLRQGLSKWNSR